MEIGLRIVLASRRLLSRAHEIAARIDPSLTAPDVAALLVVSAFPGISAGQVADLLGRDKTTMSRQVSKLDQSGLIATGIDILDGRRRTLRLTKNGELTVAPVIDALTEIEQESFKRLPSHARVTTLETLKELSK